MAYSNYGAWVFRNGLRRKDRESVPVFSSIPNMSEVIYQRIWQQTVNHYTEPDDDFNVFPDEIESQEIEIEEELQWYENIQHAVIGDGDIRIGIYKDFAILYTKSDNVSEKTIVDQSWEGFDGCYYEKPYRIEIKKYHKRRIGFDVILWKWLKQPYEFFLWINPCSKWSFLRNWLWHGPCWKYFDRMEIWMYDELNKEYWYTYTGMETGSIHHLDKIPRKVNRHSLKYMRCELPLLNRKFTGKAK